MLKEVYVGQKVWPGKEIMAVYARISVMEKLRPQTLDKHREIVDRTESERGEVLWVVRHNLG